MSGVELIFEDPPDRTRGGRRGRGRSWDLPTWCALLRQHPGRWARHPLNASAPNVNQFAGKIKGGEVPGVLPGEFEAVGRRVDGEGRLYARYVGAAS